jgi:arylsulfatase A-like enzyme/Tfp pilus assembly protein PilF
MLFGGGLVLLGLAGAMLWLRHAGVDAEHDGLTGRVLPELIAADRIEAAPGELRDFNVVMITTDTTRADHLRSYGNRSVETPAIDGLARDGVLFANANTPSPSTLPAHASLLTGLYPLRHGARANGTFQLEPRITTLAERLRGAGLRTGAAVSAFVLDSRFGLDQGFDLYHDDLTRGVKLSPHMFRERASELTNDIVLPWLSENAGERFFLFVHYFDPHAVYLPPEPFRSAYADDLYDGELAYVDAQIGALLAHLEQLGVRERTLIVYASDHGEGLGDHGERTHSLLTYESTLRVPLIFSAPERLPRGRVVERPVSLVDVVPTVLQLLGEPVPTDLDGADLTRAAAPEARPLYFETIATMTLHGWAPLLGVRRGDHKYTLAPQPELYDLRADPGELDNLHDAQPDLAASLHEELARLVGGDPLLAAPMTANLAMDDDTRQRLASLGYVQTTAPEAPLAADGRDPKEMIGHWERLQDAIHLRAQGRMREALPLLETLVEESPRDIFARSILASSHHLQGDYDKALILHVGSIEIEPNDEVLRLGAGAAYLALRELDRAEEAIQAALQIAPESGAAHIQRGLLAWHRGDPEEALGWFERAIELDPGSSGPAGHNQIGFLHLRAYRLEAARTSFEQALAIDALNGTARAGLAEVLIAEDRFDEAAQTLTLALRFDPSLPRALAVLASLTSRQGEHDQALDLIDRALELSPTNAEIHNALGLIHRRRGDYTAAEASYRRAIEYEPRLDKPHVNLAQLHLREGRNEEAIEAFEAALRANPQSRIALANLGARDFNEGRVDRAFVFYRRALAVDPDYALVHRQIASIHALRDEPRLAAHHLRRSLELEPEQADAGELRAQLARAEAAAAQRAAPAEGVDPTP